MRRGCCITLLSIAVLAINQHGVLLNEGQLGKRGEESPWQEPLGTALWRSPCGNYCPHLWADKGSWQVSRGC